MITGQRDFVQSQCDLLTGPGRRIIVQIYFSCNGSEQNVSVFTPSARTTDVYLAEPVYISVFIPPGVPVFPAAVRTDLYHAEGNTRTGKYITASGYADERIDIPGVIFLRTGRLGEEI